MTMTSSPTAHAARAPTVDFWTRDVFAVVALACALFVVLTAVAMLIYPGGSIADHASKGYRFFENYFSDLGLTRTDSGASNLPSMLCFVVALVSVAVALGIFFHAFTRFFVAAPRAHRLSRAAALAGAMASASFIGMAVAPRNLAYVAHVTCELGALLAFLVAVLCETAALRRLQRDVRRGLPRRFLWVSVGFAVALSAYLTLLALGPDDTTLAGERIQVTAQKVIVYAALATILAQSLWAGRMARAAEDESAGEARRSRVGTSRGRGLATIDYMRWRAGARWVWALPLPGTPLEEGSRAGAARTRPPPRARPLPPRPTPDSLEKYPTG